MPTYYTTVLRNSSYFGEQGGNYYELRKRSYPVYELVVIILKSWEARLRSRATDLILRA